jgi:uncharacterized protein (DUF433 family)
MPVAFADVNKSLVMFTRARLAELAGVSQRRLHYWEQLGLIEPRVARRERSTRLVRLYDYNGALSALILAALRERVSLQHIGQIVAHLRERQFEVSEVRFAVDGRRVVFQMPDGEWEDSRDLSQLVLTEVLNLRPLQAKLAQSTARDDAQVGRIERRRGAMGSKPVIAGTRIPVETVRNQIAAERSDKEILEAFPSLRAADIEAVRAAASA